MNTTEASITFLNYVASTRNLNKLTIKAYQQDLSFLIESIETQKNISSINRNDIEACVKSLFSKGQANSTVRRRLACYKSFFKWLENKDLIEQTPFSRLDLRIKLPIRIPRNVSKIELSKMRKAARNNLDFEAYSSTLRSKTKRKNTNHFTTLLAIELLLTTGLRVSELTNITLSDLHLDERFIHIRGKGQRERRVFITNENINTLIENYLIFRTSLAVNHSNFLVNRIGNPATPQTIRIWLSKLSKDANLCRKITPHMYRHSAATYLLEAGVDIRYVQRLLGHQSILTTQIYTHINDQELYKTIANANIQEVIL